MVTRRTTNQAYRMQKNVRNAQAMATRGTNLAYRIPEQIVDTYQRRLAHTDPAYRIPEQNADTNQRRLAREQPIFFMKWQLSSMYQVAHTYIISLAGYGMNNVVMGVGTLIYQVQQVPQKRNVVQMVLCLLLVTTLMKN